MSDVNITALEGLPADAQVSLSIVFIDEDGKSITVPAQVNARVPAPGAYTRYQITGTVSTSSAVNITRLTVERTYKGQNDTVQTDLVPQASDLSAFAQANYTTWLRWNYDAQRLTSPRFDVYRIKASDVPADADKTAYFAQAQLLAENLTEPYFYDYNLMYGESLDVYKRQAVEYAASLLEE